MRAPYGGHMNEASDSIARRQREMVSAHVMSWRAIPAVLVDRHLDVIASNSLARALTPSFHLGVNLARFAFLDPKIERSGAPFHAAAQQIVGMLNDSLTRHSGDTEFREIVGELSAKSQAFSEAWAESIGVHVTGTARFTDTTHGAIDLGYSLVSIPDDPEDTLIVFCATTGSAQSTLDVIITAREADA